MYVGAKLDITKKARDRVHVEVSSKTMLTVTVYARYVKIDKFCTLNGKTQHRRCKFCWS